MTTTTSMLNAVASENIHLEHLYVNTSDLLDDNVEGDILEAHPESALTAGKKTSVLKKKKTSMA